MAQCIFKSRHVCGCVVKYYLQYYGCAICLKIAIPNLMITYGNLVKHNSSSIVHVIILLLIRHIRSLPALPKSRSERGARSEVFNSHLLFVKLPFYSFSFILQALPLSLFSSSALVAHFIDWWLYSRATAHSTNWPLHISYTFHMPNDLYSAFNFKQIIMHLKHFQQQHSTPTNANIEAYSHNQLELDGMHSMHGVEE